MLTLEYFEYPCGYVKECAGAQNLVRFYPSLAGGRAVTPCTANPRGA